MANLGRTGFAYAYPLGYFMRFQFCSSIHEVLLHQGLAQRTAGGFPLGFRLYRQCMFALHLLHGGGSNCSYDMGL